MTLYGAHLCLRDCVIYIYIYIYIYISFTFCHYSGLGYLVVKYICVSVNFNYILEYI